MIIVIPSYTLASSERPTKQTCAALDRAYELCTSERGSVCIVSTGDNQNLGVTNARVMADYLIGKGLSPNQILLEELSKDTRENLLFSRSLIMKKFQNLPQNSSRFSKPDTHIVAFDLHMPRIKLLARLLGWKNLRFEPVYSDVEPAYGWRAFQTRSRLRIRIYEGAAMLFDVVRHLLVSQKM